MHKTTICPNYVELLNGRDLYKLYYDEKLTPTEREAILKRLDEIDEKSGYHFTKSISKLKNSEKEWEYTFGTKLNPLNDEDLMEIKKGERIWLFYLENFTVRAETEYKNSKCDLSLLQYPEFVHTEKSPTPYDELINIIDDIRLKIKEIESWLTERGWVKKL